MQSSIGPWSYSTVMTDTGFSRNPQRSRVTARNPLISECFRELILLPMWSSPEYLQKGTSEEISFVPLAEPFLFKNYI